MSGDIVLFDYSRSNGDRLRLTLSQFNGRPVINLRNWFTDRSGELCPGKAGLSIPAAALSELIDALQNVANETSGLQ